MNGRYLKRKYEEINAVYSPPLQLIKSSLPTLQLPPKDLKMLLSSPLVLPALRMKLV